MLHFSILRITVLVGAMAFSGLVAASSIHAQTRLGAVAVHGNAVATPRIIATDSVAATCLWGFTYWVYSKLEAAPPFLLSKQVTLSFVTVEEWAGLNANSAEVAVSDVVRTARFHTRIQLAPPGQRPHVEFWKPNAEGFVGRMQLERMVEPFLAALQIPTSIDSAGIPQVAHFSQTEVDSIRDVLRRGAPLPYDCGRIQQRA